LTTFRLTFRITWLKTFYFEKALKKPPMGGFVAPESSI
jgi:hypothetical protein